MQLTKTYKSPTRMWLGPKLYIVVWKPDQLEIILNKALEKDELYKQTERVVGKGLFTASGMLCILEFIFVYLYINS